MSRQEQAEALLGSILAAGLPRIYASEALLWVAIGLLGGAVAGVRWVLDAGDGRANR